MSSSDRLLTLKRTLSLGLLMRFARSWREMMGVGERSDDIFELSVRLFVGMVLWVVVGGREAVSEMGCLEVRVFSIACLVGFSVVRGKASLEFSRMACWCGDGVWWKSSGDVDRNLVV